MAPPGRRSRPVNAAASSIELPMLLRVAGVDQRHLVKGFARQVLMVSRSASSWVGWYSLVRPFHTGTPAYCCGLHHFLAGRDTECRQRLQTGSTLYGHLAAAGSMEVFDVPRIYRIWLSLFRR